MSPGIIANYSLRFDSLQEGQRGGSHAEPTTMAVIHAKAINRTTMMRAIDSLVSDRFLLSKKVSRPILWS
jgi:hypothetical protein